MAFIDLKAQQERIKPQLDAAIARVLANGNYISGPEVAEFEQQLADYVGVAHAVSCGNGTDALQIALLAEGIGAGDAVFVPSFTFAATAEMVALIGATPVFVDIDPNTFNIDVEHLEATIDAIASAGDLKPRAIIPVDLFGLPADYASIEAIAAKHGLYVLEDGAQGFGGTQNGRRACSFGTVATTSFFPAKPLGCYGDGGAVLTNDPERAAVMRSLCIHGKGTDKYDNVRIGMNSRLDTLQAAILKEKLAVFDEELVSRQAAAERYEAALSNHVRTPRVPAGFTSSWAQYSIIVDGDRSAVMASLKESGIPSVVYYAKPLHLQTAYKHYPVGPGGLPKTEFTAEHVMSLPMHPYLDEATQAKIIDAVKNAVAVKEKV
ncbi:DegT/DnrJ/EryC1/StrS family aminotransferase [Amorphus orientalis]|uniref:DegT/DnrJ/EryC1/StrS family aminotransferase n=1 Tax=Amorphus orientalis TaxID=649198 RepID=UPI0027D8059F|nr:DegT/DnrJ/EryC1/StrS aminotransferase family protein [Amorphus orientalis]